MFFEKFEFLSSPITLFYQGSSSHSSPMSGILSIATILIVVLFSIREIKVLLKEMMRLQNQQHLHILKKMLEQLH